MYTKNSFHNNSPENIYVESLLLNGKILSGFPFIDHIETVQLDFYMSSTLKSIEKMN
jgi:hypothetical protein